MTEPFILKHETTLHYRSFTRSKMQMNVRNQLYCCHLRVCTVLGCQVYIVSVYFTCVYRSCSREKNNQNGKIRNKRRECSVSGWAKACERARHGSLLFALGHNVTKKHLFMTRQAQESSSIGLLFFSRDTKSLTAAPRKTETLTWWLDSQIFWQEYNLWA